MNDETTELKRGLDTRTKEWLRQDAYEAVRVYHDMLVPRGSAADCALMCVTNQMRFYGGSDTTENLDFVEQAVSDAMDYYYGKVEAA